MNKLTRRDFIQKTAGLAGASMLVPHQLFGRTMKTVPGYELGFQSWVVRETLVKDFAGTLKQVSAMGYETIEMCSPPGYSMAGFAPLAELSASEMKNILNDAGLTCHSFHYIFPELQEHGQERMDFAEEIGLSQMVVSSFMLRGETTLDDWKKAAHELNQLGEQSAERGLQMGFHNHHGEFAELEGRLIYDVLLDELDPDLVKMQFQVAVANIGFKAADYFRNHPGRFISAHLSDWSEVGEDTTQVPIGQGIVDWPDFFEAAKVGGLKNCYVEMNPATFEDSAEYLKSLG